VPDCEVNLAFAVDMLVKLATCARSKERVWSGGGVTYPYLPAEVCHVGSYNNAQFLKKMRSIH
jgi:hypothetical protein